jgi:zinc protease
MAVLVVLACAHEAATPTPASQPQARMIHTIVPPQAERAGPLQFRLDNGLTVILEENHSAPVVAFQAWVGVGSADEGPEEIGLAHVFEHMLFKGTERRGVGQIAREVEAAGGDINAWTSFDETVYHMVLASRWFDTGLDILADAVQHSSFDPAELDKELKVVLEEIKQGEDSPSRTAAQALFSLAYQNHPYGRPVIGTAEAVSRITRQRLIDFFHKHYVPANITLVVVGDFDPTVARTRIEAAWGSHVHGPDAKPTTRRPLPPEPAQKETRATVTAQDVRETHLAIAFHAPEMHSDDAAALDVLAIILGQGDSSRLNVDVKRSRQLASEVYAYTHTPREPGLFVVGATVVNTGPSAAGDPPDVAATERALLDEIYRLGHEEIGNDELQKARTLIESDEVYQKETVQGMARKLGWFATIAGSLDYEIEYQKQVRALTPARLREAAARWLRPENASISAVIPSTSAATPEAADTAAVGKKLAQLARDESTAVAARYQSAPATQPSGEVVRRVLPNGVHVLVKRDPSVPVVAMRAVWEGGLRDEDERTNGVHHMLAVLLTRGCRGKSGEEIAREVEGMAGSIGGFSGRNSFGVRAEMLARDWERGFDIFADCILDPEIPEAELEKERRQVLDDLHAQEDSLSGVVFRLFSETLYLKHPYRFDLLGSPGSVAGFTREMILDYYRRHFPLADMTIAVVGDVDPDKIIARLTAKFGGPSEHRPQPPKLPRADLWARPKGPVEVFKFRDKLQAHLVVGFPGTTVDDPDRFALEVLSTVLSGQGGRLFVELRDKQGLAYRVGAFSLEGIDPGYFAVYIATSPENLPAAYDGIKAELRRVVDEPVPADELERAKRYIVGAHDISLQRRAAMASTLAFHEAYGLGWDEYKRYAAGILAVDAAAVQRVAAAYLDWDHAVIATVKPEELTPGAAARKQGVVRKPPQRKPGR